MPDPVALYHALRWPLATWPRGIAVFVLYVLGGALSADVGRALHTPFPLIIPLMILWVLLYVSRSITPVWYKEAAHERYGGVQYGRGKNRRRYWYYQRTTFKPALLHRTTGPAIIGDDGHEEWWCNGQRHRADGPAIIHANGRKEWWQDDALHREDGPAIIGEDGEEEWRRNGQRHRLGGAAIIRVDGHEEWWENGQRHRLDGPAVIHADGGEEWWENGQLHRAHGPAVAHADGREEWYKHGQRQSDRLRIIPHERAHTLADALAPRRRAPSSPMCE